MTTPSPAVRDDGHASGGVDDERSDAMGRTVNGPQIVISPWGEYMGGDDGFRSKPGSVAASDSDATSPAAVREGELRDPTTGEPVTDFDRDGYPVVNNIDHPSLFWGQFAVALVTSWRVDDEGDGDE